MEHVDKLIIHAHLFTMEGDGVGYMADGAVAVRGERITAVAPTPTLLASYQANEIIDATDHAVLPGLVDAHMHTPWAIARGVAQDVSNWMQQALAPYSRHQTAASMLAGTKLNVIEALKTGTTTFGDYTKTFPGWAEFYESIGVRGAAHTYHQRPAARGHGWLESGRCLSFE